MFSGVVGVQDIAEASSIFLEQALGIVLSAPQGDRAHYGWFRA
jgi:hypothetical protein